MTLTPRPEVFQIKSQTVSALAWLGIVSGVLGCFGAVVAFVTAPGVPPLRLLLGPPVALAAAIGLHNRRDWARWSYIAVFGLGIVGLAATIVRQGVHGPMLVAALIGVLINGLLIGRLCSHDVREEFSDRE